MRSGRKSLRRVCVPGVRRPALWSILLAILALVIIGALISAWLRHQII
jgi:ABC-type phosphate/phosphonate transport system permease subunit